MKLVRTRIGAVCAIAMAVVMAGAAVFMAQRSAANEAKVAALKSPPVQLASNPESTGWDKRWWIDKTARLLRGGYGIGPDDDVEALSKLSREEIARKFMSDPRFGDTALDFNMFFLGFKTNTLKIDGSYARPAFDFANAVSSARALMSGGDYLKLFDLEGEFYMAPLQVEHPEPPADPQDAKLTPAQLRQKAVGEFYKEFETLLAFRNGSAALQGNDFCEEVEEVTDRREEIEQKLFRAFGDPEIFALVRGGVAWTAFDALEKTVQEECEKPEGKVNAQRLTAVIQSSLDHFKATFKEVFAHEFVAYRPKTLMDFKPFNLAAFPENKKWLGFGYEQGIALANSSTNYNRKRSAYVLRRYFCDDITPVGSENPKEHTSGVHGSQTSCYACHYKLDPMAGFFRDYGAQFFDSAKSPDIVFDDLASVDREAYQSAWKAAPGSKMKWNTGYIRSPRWNEQNGYGESMADLSRIIRKAPEAKRCLMKRLSEYMIGEDQTIDGAYIDHLTKLFDKEATRNSSAAMKNAIARIVQSEVYRQRNPDPQLCYDHAPGTKAGNGPPCRVAYILQKNCAQCHDGTFEGKSDLDLTAWIAAPGGKNHTFPLVAKGKQLDAQEIMKRMAEHIVSNDPKTRMPKNKLMLSQERQELFLWAQGELARLSKE